ncbi:MAG TPA: FHA domain-containing protein [Quisquiliibacterium sp.]|nr:FHA domain-containing protein [Quisquiliibacterium sp.]HQP67683.1 FHA domain-containing protein [Quisquiliibacterium sp.]
MSESPMRHHEEIVAARLVLSAADGNTRSYPILTTDVRIGRRPFNEVVLDDLTVSGAHAVIVSDDGRRLLRDLDSRNGTVLNGTPIRSARLEHGDLIEIGVYRLRYLVDRAPVAPARASADAPPTPAALERMSGPERGRMLALERPITSISGGASQVAVVSRRKNGYYVTHLEGLAFPVVNGDAIGLVSHPLLDGDLIELSGTLYRFRQRDAR